MKLYTENDLIDLVQLLKDYTYKSQKILGYDEREAKEFVDIFLADRTPIELPSDEEILTKSKEEPDNSDIETAARIGYVAGAKWMRDQIQGGNK